MRDCQGWGQLAYQYDVNGNRTREALTAGGTTTTLATAYAPTANWPTQVTTNGTPSRTFAHDAAGNVSTDTRAATIWAFTHNAAGRLAEASEAGTTRGSYTYDGMERLAIRSAGGVTTHLIYDTAGHLLAEANGATGATMREYIWLEVEDFDVEAGPMRRPANDNGRSGSRERLGAAENDNDPTSRAQLPSLNGPKRGLAERAVPLAVVADVDTATPGMLFVHADHLDRPVRMTDAGQNLVWDAVYKPFGEVQSISGSASLDARFPGQWFQIETGLHYNWHRTYDPTTGRYLQPDPLEFVNGPSVYSYALGSPLMNSDRQGLFLPIVIGAAVGIGLDHGISALRSRCTCSDTSSALGAGGYGAVGAVGGGFGPFATKSRTGISGGGLAGDKTSTFSKGVAVGLRMGLYSPRTSHTLRILGRRLTASLPYIGVGLLGHELYRAITCT